MVKAYIKSVCEAGGSVSSQVVIAAARGILKSLDKTKLQEFGCHIDLTRHWAHSFLTRMIMSRGREQQQRANILRQILLKRKKNFWKN